MICACDIFFVAQINSSFSFQSQVATALYCTRSLDLLLIFIFGAVFTGQVTGHGAYGEKGQKGEPAVIEPVSTDVGEGFLALYNICTLLTHHYQAMLFMAGCQ